MADVRWPKMRTVVCCGAVLVVISLSFSLVLLCVLTDDSDKLGTPAVRSKIVRWDRSILDVYSANVNVEKEAQGVHTTKERTY